MKKGYARDFPGSKVYFTEADPSAQTLYRITPPHFDLKIKLWLLLTDHTILSTGHMLSSDTTYEWLRSNFADICELANQRAILPSIREDRDSFKEWVLYHPEEDGQFAPYATHKDLLLERANTLADVFPTAITWSPAGESQWFRDAMVKDLKEEESPLRRRLVGVPNSSIYDLANGLEACESPDREKTSELIRRHCPQRRNILSRYRDIFYYLSGSLFKNAFPLLHPASASLCLEKVSYEGRCAGVFNPEQEVWQEILDTWGVTSQSLRRLPLAEIAKIRRDSLGMRVRQTWGKILEEARHAQTSIESLSAFESAKNELVHVFAREVLKQRKRRQHFGRVRDMLEVMSWVTGGLASFLTFCLTDDVLASAEVGAGAAVLGFLTGKPILDAVERRTSGTELVVLTTRIGQLAVT